jgi:hypothetical protein
MQGLRATARRGRQALHCLLFFHRFPAAKLAGELQVVLRFQVRRVIEIAHIGDSHAGVPGSYSLCRIGCRQIQAVRIEAQIVLDLLIRETRIVLYGIAHCKPQSVSAAP